jgi:hypothetical protein
MRTRILFLALVATAGLLNSACSTTTARHTATPATALAPVEVTGHELFGGAIGREVATTVKPTQLPKSRFSNLQERAYLVWKHANKS